MSKRRIVVFSNANGQREVFENSEVRIWGELKPLIIEKGIQLNKLDAVVRGSRTTLQLDEAVLPAEEFTLICVEKEMKSGNNLYIPFENLKKSEFKKICKHWGIKVDGDIKDLEKRVKSKQRRIPEPLTIEDVDRILGREPEVPTKEATADVPEVKEETPIDAKANGNLTVPEAMEQVDAVLEKAQDDVVNIISNIRTTVTQALQGVDVFDGVEEDAKSIQAELRR